MSDDPRALPPAEPRGEPTTIELDGEPVRAFAGEPVAVALFAGGVRLLGRSPKYHRPRGLFCASGHCASCLMRIDGRPNQRACLVPSRPDLRCERQNAFPDAEIDLLRAADWLFPKGMDHHRLMTGSRLGNQLFVKLVRQMGGTGLLPDQAPRGAAAAGGRGGRRLHRRGRPGGAGGGRGRRAPAAARVLVVDDQDRPGGSLLAEPGGVARGAQLAADATAAAVAAGGQLTLWPSATALAYYPEERVLAVRRPGGLARVTRPPVPVRHRQLRSEPAHRGQRSPRHPVGARGGAAGVPLRRPARAGTSTSCGRWTWRPMPARTSPPTWPSWRTACGG